VRIGVGVNEVVQFDALLHARGEVQDLGSPHAIGDEVAQAQVFIVTGKK
jgi:hypothetical protein